MNYVDNTFEGGAGNYLTQSAEKWYRKPEIIHVT